MQKIKRSKLLLSEFNNYGNTNVLCKKKKKGERDSSKVIRSKVDSTEHNSHEKLPQEKVPWSNKFKILYTIFFAEKNVLMYWRLWVTDVVRNLF